MEADEEEENRWRRGDWRERGRGDGRLRVNEEERLAVNRETIRSGCEEELCWLNSTRQRDRVEKRSRRRVWRQRRRWPGKRARWGTRVRCRRGWRGGSCPPSYHAASMGPLIFAALRFCLALSTLHTSTADRRHKTLYRDSAEREKEKGKPREKGESRENRSDPTVVLHCIRYIQRMYACITL